MTARRQPWIALPLTSPSLISILAVSCVRFTVSFAEMREDVPFRRTDRQRYTSKESCDNDTAESSCFKSMPFTPRGGYPFSFPPSQCHSCPSRPLCHTHLAPAAKSGRRKTIWPWRLIRYTSTTQNGSRTNDGNAGPAAGLAWLVPPPHRLPCGSLVFLTFFLPLSTNLSLKLGKVQ